MNAGRTASVSRRAERLAALALRVVADGKIALEEPHLLPMVMHERRGGEGAGLKAQEPRAASHLAPLVEVAGEDLLLDRRRIAFEIVPARIHIDFMEFEMRLVHRHGCCPFAGAF